MASVTGNTFTDIGLLTNTPYVYSVRNSGGTTPQITLTYNADTASLLIDEPDPAALLTDGRADHLAALLTQAAGQAKQLATILEDAADDADGLAAVLTDDRTDDQLDQQT